MFKSIHHGRYLIKYGLVNRKGKASILLGESRAKGSDIIEADTPEIARDKAIGWIDKRIEEQRSQQRIRSIATSEQYTEAFSVPNVLNETHKRYFQVHATLGKATNTQLAEAVRGDVSHLEKPYAIVNQLYGRLGKHLQEFLNLEPMANGIGETFYLYHLVEANRSASIDGIFESTLHPEVVDALNELGIIQTS